MRRSIAITIQRTFSLSALVLLGLLLVTQPAQSQTASVESPEAKDQITKSVGNYKLTVPRLNENATGGNPAPAGAGAAPQGISSFSGRASARDRNAPHRTNLQAIKIVKYVNGLIGGFDQQGSGFGYGLEVTTDDLIPLVEVYGRAISSTLLYRQGEAGVYVGTEKTRGNIFFNYQRRTKDNIFGIGPRTAKYAVGSVESNYATESRSVNGILSHKFFKQLEGGLYGRFSNTGSFKGVDDDDIVINNLFSGDPATAVTNPVIYTPGLNSNVELVSYGGYGELDLRNNDKGLTQGAYFYGRFGSVDGIDNGNTFSDYGWLETELDGRVYVPVLSRKTSVALRAYADLREPKGGSQIPFYELASFGGRNLGRGFQTFRFRANNMVLFSGEVRQTVWTMEEDRGVDVIGFVDGGQVWGDNRSKTNPLIQANDQFSERNYRIGAGGGLSYRYNKSTVFRLDVGSSNERTLIYFAASRGF
jgi:hypothetical protein